MKFSLYTLFKTNKNSKRQVAKYYDARSNLFDFSGSLGIHEFR